ncbi:MAG: di-trans,poly-cis-decaprenylcistransferase [Bacillales bacterium]|jgi:undecaprenyl diphosphate synthase|nr:di-trans,poly-cis-decaprenylcistransferase [Bacillales bacterium]
MVDSLAQHVAIIMDGNGRWAKARGYPRSFGHKKGSENIENILKEAIALKIPYLSLYTFSLENNKREQKEIDYLFNLLKIYFKKEVKRLLKNDIRVRFLGFTELLSKDIQEVFQETSEQTKHCQSLNLNICFNYGGQQEIIRASKLLARDYKENKIDLDKVNFNDYLFTKDMPFVDVLIRTGKELRISNFFLFQSAYAEFFFTDTLWPDFTPKEFRSIILAYQERNRRFGGL